MLWHWEVDEIVIYILQNAFSLTNILKEISACEQLLSFITGSAMLCECTECDCYMSMCSVPSRVHHRLVNPPTCRWPPSTTTPPPLPRRPLASKTRLQGANLPRVKPLHPLDPSQNSSRDCRMNRLDTSCIVHMIDTNNDFIKFLCSTKFPAWNNSTDMILFYMYVFVLLNCLVCRHTCRKIIVLSKDNSCFRCCINIFLLFWMQVEFSMFSPS